MEILTFRRGLFGVTFKIIQFAARLIKHLIPNVPQRDGEVVSYVLLQIG